MKNISVVGAAASFVLFAVFLRMGNASVDSVVNIQNTLLRSAFLESGSTFSAVSAVLAPFSSVIISLVFLVLGLSFLSSYGYFETDRRAGAVSGIVGAAALLVLFTSVAGAAVALAVFLASIYIMPLSNAYGKELKKWVFFRTGSNSVGRALMIVNIIIALGIFFSVLAGLQSYRESFRAELTESLTEVTLSSLPPEARSIAEPQVRSQVESTVETSNFFQAYFRWLPVFSALGVWIVFEFLRNIVFSNLGGLLTSVMIRFSTRK